MKISNLVVCEQIKPNGMILWISVFSVCEFQVLIKRIWLNSETYAVSQNHEITKNALELLFIYYSIIFHSCMPAHNFWQEIPKQEILFKTEFLCGFHREIPEWMLIMRESAAD